MKVHPGGRYPVVEVDKFPSIYLIVPGTRQHFDTMRILSQLVLLHSFLVGRYALGQFCPTPILQSPRTRRVCPHLQGVSVVDSIYVIHIWQHRHTYPPTEESGRNILDDSGEQRNNLGRVIFTQYHRLRVANIYINYGNSLRL